jgi:hypothetical protein
LRLSALLESKVSKAMELAAPRRPLTPYIRFMKETQQRIRDELPREGTETAREHATRIFRAVASKWSELGATEKNRYDEAYRRDVAKYDSERAKHRLSEFYKPPAATPNGYALFVKERWRQIGAGGDGQAAGGGDVASVRNPRIIRQIASEWQQLPAAEKQRYQEKAVQERAEYQKNVDRYMQNRERIRQQMEQQNPHAKA